MITLIYPYRNRSLSRIKKSLDSLVSQTNQDFEVQFIDYGSDLDMAKKVEKLVTAYTFTNYTFSYHIDTMWNKSRALNIIIKNLKTSYCFVADIDMIFHPEFVSTLQELKKQHTVTYFKVGFLSSEESEKTIPFEQYKIKFTSTNEATGLTLFPVDALKKVNGFDEFYHLWGAEDTDIHNRLKLCGLSIKFFDSKILMLHQYHKIYRQLKDDKITRYITIKSISRINQEYCKTQYAKKQAIANLDFSWGNKQSKEEYTELLTPNKSKIVSLRKESFKVWLKTINNQSGDEIILYQFKGSNSWLHNSISKLVGKYTLKQASDLLLQNHIEHLRNKKYLYRVSKDCKIIDYTLCQK